MERLQAAPTASSVFTFGRVSQPMKKFPFTLPEWGFIILVMLLPLVAALVWQSGNFLGFIAKAGGGMVVGFGVWLGLIFWACRRYDRRMRDENSKAEQ